MTAKTEKQATDDANAQGGRDADGQDPGTQLMEYNAEMLESTPGLREAFLVMLAEVPEPGDDAAARIVAEILAAQDVESLDRPWDVEGMRDYDGVMVRVKSVAKMPSDYTGGLGVYLVCRCDQPEIGEEFTLTTGSVSIVAQLVRAHTLNALPLVVTPRKSERPTRNGYYPMHLELVRRGRRVRAQVIDQGVQS